MKRAFKKKAFKRKSVPGSVRKKIDGVSIPSEAHVKTALQNVTAACMGFRGTWKQHVELQNDIKIIYTKLFPKEPLPGPVPPVTDKNSKKEGQKNEKEN